MPAWIAAGGAGLIAGAALMLGSLVAWFVQVPARVVAAIMAFGSGVLISALAFELVEEAIQTGGLIATILGFLSGALTYVVMNVLLARYGARHRKRSGDQQPSRPSTLPVALRSPSVPCSTGYRNPWCLGSAS